MDKFHSIHKRISLLHIIFKFSHYANPQVCPTVHQDMDVSVENTASWSETKLRLVEHPRQTPEVTSMA